jgi:two-component system CheB/CheR fusion protein
MGKGARQKNQPTDAFPIVAIGMSAGGLETATQFLNAMPPKSGLGFVIIQHLEPTRKSLLTELLAKQTKMPVVEIEEGMRVEPDRVHVIIPNKTVLIKDGVLKLVPPAEARGRRHPIDKFFTALAHDRAEKAIGIILSGAGSNGTAGLLDIKNAGGMCMVQDPATAKFDSMPRHAINTGQADFVLSPEKMPKALLGYVRHPYTDGGEPPEAAAKGRSSLDDVLTLIRARTGHDFRPYKRNTLLRRTYRRMGLAHIEKLDDYLTALRNDPEEVLALNRDLMINVTAFFRDDDAWDALDRDAITPIVDRAAAHDHVRVWVPACSTGEEAYSIAMLLDERIEEAGKPLNVKIFATDVADQNLSSARKGLFPASMVESMPPERLERFFDRAGDDYQVKPDIRETVLFAPQNLLTDPPYSRMDLVSCRNFLIYLQPEAQDRVLSLAHFALRQGGYLFLGNAETVGSRDHLFETVSKRWRIYKRIGPARSSAIDFAAWPAREMHAGASTEAPKLADVAARTIAGRYGPASVIIDEHFRIQHFHGETDNFLSHPKGAPTFDLLTLARKTMTMAIRRAVQDARKKGGPVSVAAGDDDKTVVTAEPIGSNDQKGLTLVSFSRPNEGAASAPVRKARKTAESGREQQLEEELQAARDELRGTVEQFETSNEELKAANEEVTSVNEELQATNEELETSKEELQSLNEELSAVNSQLERKLEELEQAGDDLKNLLAGNEIATIFLDANMRIKWFSPAVKELFDLVDRDVGRPISNFAQKFVDGDLAGKARAAMDRLATFEEDVQAENGKYFLLRVQPYRTRDNRIAGAVASFVDITDLKRKQGELREARDFAEAIVSTVRDPLLVLTGDFKIVSANPAFYQMFKLKQADIEGQPWFEIADRQWDVPRLHELLEKMLPEKGQVNDFEVEHDFPKLGKRCILVNARRIAGQGERPELILIAKEDITDRRNSERHQDLLVGELSHRVKNTLTIVQSIATQTMRNSKDLDQFDKAFFGRLHALARAHDMVLNSGFNDIELGSIIEQAVKPFQVNGQIKVGKGPSVPLGQAASQCLTLLLHELSTNAVKYGALSADDGTVGIDWKVAGRDGSRRVTLSWNERGGPEVTGQPRSSHGTRFIERSVAHDLRGQAKLNFEPSGLRATIAFPAEEADKT